MFAIFFAILCLKILTQSEKQEDFVDGRIMVDDDFQAPLGEKESD